VSGPVNPAYSEIRRHWSGDYFSLLCMKHYLEHSNIRDDLDDTELQD
jgi:hypothetical protein